MVKATTYPHLHVNILPYKIPSNPSYSKAFFFATYNHPHPEEPQEDTQKPLKKYNSIKMCSITLTYHLCGCYHSDYIDPCPDYLEDKSCSFSERETVLPEMCWRCLCAPSLEGNSCEFIKIETLEHNECPNCAHHRAY